MLSVLTQLARQHRGVERNGYCWFQFNRDTIEQSFPFWQPVDIQRVCNALREQGLMIIASVPYTQSFELKFAFNEKVAQRQSAPAPQPPRVQSHQANYSPGGKNFISPSWQPDQETLNQLAQHNIPSQFALEQVPEFVRYWMDRGQTAHSWGSKFFKQVKINWEKYRAREHAQNSQTPMTRNWRPSEDAMEVLTVHAGISRQFVEDAIPEFELYWREQGARSDNWNKKFRDHVQRQWLRYCSALEHDTAPRRIEQNWTPSEDVFEVLRLANIDVNFARSLVQEFVIYWRDTNQVHSSWNTRFLQFVKRRWAKRDEPQALGTKSTRDLSLVEQLTDRSWAL